MRANCFFATVARIAGGVVLAVIAALPAAGPLHAITTAEPAPASRRDYGYIRVGGGTELAYVVYRPQKPGRYPAVLQYDPYLGGGNPPDPEFLKRGYVFVGVNVPGTGCSQGALDYFGPKESAAGADVVEWIARQPWSSGDVGLWSYSYPGHKAVQIAALRPPHLRAIVAGALTRSTYEDGYYPGGLFNVGLFAAWKPVFQPQLEAMGLKNRREWTDTRCDANIAARPADTHLRDVVERRNDAAWWHERALSTVIDRVAVPTLLAHNWQDQLLKSGDTLFAQLHVPKKLLLMNGGHSYATVQPEMVEATFRWFDRWLKHEHNGVEREPPVTVLWETRVERGKQPPLARWQTVHADWPLPEADFLRMRLSGRGELLAGPPGDANGRAPLDFLASLGTEFIGSDVQFALAPDPAGTVVYRTPPLDAPLTILGAPEVKLSLRSDNRDVDLMVVLHDIYPNGDTEYLQRAVVRASAVAGAQLVPGEPRELTIRLPSIGVAIRRGHRLELAIMSPPTIPSPTWAFEPLGLSGRTTLLHDDMHPSELLLPILRNAPEPPPALDCGALPLQPCRRAANPKAKAG